VHGTGFGEQPDDPAQDMTELQRRADGRDDLGEEPALDVVSDGFLDVPIVLWRGTASPGPLAGGRPGGSFGLPETPAEFITTWRNWVASISTTGRFTPNS